MPVTDYAALDLSNNEVTCAIPAPLLAELVAKLTAVREADSRVAAYVGEDGKRFV